MDDTDEPASEVIEQLRQVMWEVPIARDHLLKVVERMPSFVRERAQGTAGQLTAVQAQIQGLIAGIPADVELPERLIRNLVGLRRSIQHTLRDVDLLTEDLRCMLWEPREGEAPPYLAN